MTRGTGALASGNVDSWQYVVRRVEGDGPFEATLYIFNPVVSSERPAHSTKVSVSRLGSVSQSDLDGWRDVVREAVANFMRNGSF
jgi:hypothetical protein